MTRIKQTVEIPSSGLYGLTEPFIIMATAEGWAGDLAVAIAEGVAENCLLRRGTDKFTFATITDGCVWVWPLFVDEGGVLRDSYRKQQAKGQGFNVS
jgi:hypothetical protein